MAKKIYRSNTNRMISGVCGGLGEYFSIDPVIIRLFWLLLTFSTNGGGFIAYIICTIVIPEEDDRIIYYDETTNSNNTTFKNTSIFLGVALIVVGSILLVKRIWPQFSLKYFRFSKYWPVILIIGGVYVIYKQKSEK